MYEKTVAEALRELQTTPQGLTGKEARARLSKHGANTLREQERESAIRTFLQQFNSLPIYLLALAAIIAGALGERIEAIAIGAIIVLNAIIGHMQERKAGDAIAALKRLTSLKVKCYRDGTLQLIDAIELVPGDVISLEAGDKVPADGRIIDSHNAQTLEAPLTGESRPVLKSARTLTGKHGLGDRENMVFAGTIVASGRLFAAISSTGMRTELGNVAEMIDDVQEAASPLKIKVDSMVRRLSVVILILTALVFAALLWRTQHGDIQLFDALITSIALAVAALPEGLPIVLTVTSALGVKRMVKRHVLIRKLMSVETLGSVTVICSDKTGTLTKNQMTVRSIYVNGLPYAVTGEGYGKGGEIGAPKSQELEQLLTCGSLCNNATQMDNKVTGDPTEIALIVSAKKAGLMKDRLEHEHRRHSETEFTSERKIMSTVHEHDRGYVQYTKGAADMMLSKCSRISLDGNIRKMTRRDILSIKKQMHAYSEQALRVLAFAYRPVKAPTEAEEDLIFLGLQAMIDPPRSSVREAIANCKSAGIKVVMITGDHPDTASAIARELGLEVKVFTGDQIEELKDLGKVVEDVIVYARVNPEHKLRIVAALQRHGHTVAMTGDGVNDAPALKKADIGVAMGIAGTDVSKEASKMIIADDNFTSIVNAVEEGRSIYDNIQKFVRYQLSTNAGALLVVIASIVARLPLPLLPLQLLWINLSVDGPPALSLGIEPSDPRVLKRPPRPKKEPLVTRGLLMNILAGGLIMAIGTFAVFATHLSDYTLATSMAFTTFAFFQFFNVFNCRSIDESVFTLRMNWMALWIVLGMLAVHLCILYIPFLQRVFHVTALSASELGLCALVASSILLLYEGKKFVWKAPTRI